MAEFIHIDKLLTNMATRYRVNDAVADFVAPPFKVKKSSDKYVEYGKGSLRVYDNKISGREKAPEIDVELTSSSYACEEYSLGKFVSNNARQNADKPINMDLDAMRKLKDAMLLSREKRVADIATSTSIVTNYFNAAGDWDDETNGTPIADIRVGMAKVWEEQAGSAGANAIVIPMDVSIKMIGTDEYRDYFKYSGLAAGEQFNIISGLRHLGLTPMICGAFGANTNQNGASDPGAEAIWSDNVLIFNRQKAPNLETRTFMYSPFTYKDTVQRFKKEEERGVKFVMYEEIDELLVDSSAAYLITNTL